MYFCQSKVMVVAQYFCLNKKLLETQNHNLHKEIIGLVKWPAQWCVFFSAQPMITCFNVILNFLPFFCNLYSLLSHIFILNNSQLVHGLVCKISHVAI